MDQSTLSPAIKVNGIQFYKHPYLEVVIAINPSAAIHDLWKVWKARIRCREDAEDALFTLLSRCRKCSLQSLIYLEYENFLPENKELTSLILRLNKVDNVCFTPAVNPANYSANKLFDLFEIDDANLR